MKRLKKLWLRIRVFFRLIFHFRKPAFEQLEISDWLFEQKPLLVIKWESGRRYMITVKEAKLSSDQRSGFQILRLGKSAEQVTVVLRSGWRKSVFVYPLKKLILSEELVSGFLRDASEYQWPAVHPFRAAAHRFEATVNAKIETRLPQALPGHRLCNYQTDIPTITVTPFQYSSNLNQLVYDAT